MGLYDLGCAAGPTIGPIIAGYAVDAKGWRWSFYEMIWISGFALALLSFTLPEVSAIVGPGLDNSPFWGEFFTQFP